MTDIEGAERQTRDEDVVKNEDVSVENKVNQVIMGNRDKDLPELKVEQYDQEEHGDQKLKEKELPEIKQEEQVESNEENVVEDVPEEVSEGNDLEQTSEQVPEQVTEITVQADNSAEQLPNTSEHPPNTSEQQDEFKYGNHQEYEFDNFPSLKGNIDQIVKFDKDNSQLINHATIKALIIQLTSPEIIDYNLVYDFFITYRMFSNSETVMRFLMIRLIWSLQNINDQDPNNVKLGQAVLLRTFVVIRHWILNYFIDDFNDDHNLCDTFITMLNDIIFKSELVNTKMVFEIKILKDLKIHWLKCVNEFWHTNVDLEVPDMLNFKLPLTNELMKSHLVKSPTELSLHTNPSYRRSAMLSLYDSKIHKVLVYDNKQIENPQLSINNILTQYQSSRQSIMNKLNNIQIFRSKSTTQTPKKNRMNLNDSSTGLKKLNHKVNIDSKISLSPIEIDNVGFSTNGNIKLPSSRIYNIVPSTPVRKMEYIINYSNANGLSSIPSDDNIEVDEYDDTFAKPLNRKKSLKKILEAWKKSVYHKQEDVEEPIIGDRFDVLTARIVDELEFLIRYYINNPTSPIIEGDTINSVVKDEVNKDQIDLDLNSPRDSVDLIGSPAKRYQVTTSTYQSPQEGAVQNIDDSDIDINDLSELNFNKIDNLINEPDSEDDDNEIFGDSHDFLTDENLANGGEGEQPGVHEFSFQRPTSINWNEELELSHVDSKHEQQIEPPFVFKTDSQSSAISTPSNMTAYDAEIQDLGIAMSPQSMKDKTRRITIGSSIFKRDSVKSYISYDSAFSVSNNSNRHTEQDDQGLKKKAAIKDLRTLARLPSQQDSTKHSIISRRSIRYSTVRALAELPFNDSRRMSKTFPNRGSIQTLTDSDSNLDNSKHSVAIPGISNSILKELAAIPDESFHFNPIESALGKLEGKNRDSGSDITHVDDTQDILNEIENANTEDVIDSSSVKEMVDNSSAIGETSSLVDDIHSLNVKEDIIESSSMKDQELPLQIPTTPRKNAKVSKSEQQSVDDNVFIFSANYTKSTSSKQISPAERTPGLTLENYLTNDNLNIEKVIHDNNHISFLLSYTSQQLSEHFTIIERDILQEIDWKELIELNWNKQLTPVNSWLEIIVNEDYYNTNKGVNLVIARFNLMVNWIISEVLLTSNQSERIGIISRFIHIAQNCLELQNYSTLMQILLALTSEKISKLKETWKNLNPGDILILKNLEELSSPLKNFINLRVSINQIQPSKGAIPFVGLYLSDLIFNTERPKFINKDKTLVNFARFRTSVHIVKSLTQCIEWSSYYNLPIDDELLSKCLYLRSLDDDEMNYCLSQAKDL